MRNFFVVVCLLLLATTATTATFAAEGRIPIFEPVELIGADIGGQYTVVRNITNLEGPVIRIVGTGLERVEIDLNGFTVRRMGDGSAIEVSNVRSFVVRNGSATTTGLAVVPDEPAVVLIRDTALSGEVIVEGLRVSGGTTGIRLTDVPNFAIRDNVVTGSEIHGIQTIGDNENGTAIGGSIVNNQVLGVDDFGIWIGNDSTAVDGIIVKRNRVDAAGDDGILVRNARSFIVENNTITDSDRSGIKIQSSSSGRVSGNTVAGCGSLSGAGIFVLATSQDVMIVGNNASDNLQAGFAISGSSNLIRDNVSNRNAGGGFDLLGSDHVFDGNIARNNTSADPDNCTAAPPGQCSYPDFCDSGTNDTTGAGTSCPAPAERVLSPESRPQGTGRAPRCGHDRCRSVAGDDASRVDFFEVVEPAGRSSDGVEPLVGCPAHLAAARRNRRRRQKRETAAIAAME